MKKSMSEINSNELEKHGRSPESDMESLLLREAKLQERLKAIAADFRSGLDQDSEERAQQLENREVLEEIERVTTIELARVRQLIADAKARLPGN